MKRFLPIITLALLAMQAVSLSAQQSKQVLFVGNSYTSVNDLPQMVSAVALSMGDTVNYSVNAPGGCTFLQHCTNQSMNLIRQGGWDVVVLQEQSQYPSFPQNQVEAEVFPYAAQLVDSIYAHGWCTVPMFYMTWGRRDGDAYNAQFFPPLGTYEGMDSLLYLRYMQMGQMNDADVCPVGRVWHRLRQQWPQIELYQSDGSHPTVAGTYAAACAFYTMFFLRDPDSITYLPEIGAATGEAIRSVVRSVVFDSLERWQRTQPAVHLMLMDTVQYMSCSFGVASEDCDSICCDWGDGAVDCMAATEVCTFNHLYADTGLYVITVTGMRHCLTATQGLEFYAQAEPVDPPDPPDPPEGIAEAEQQQVVIYPNPAATTVHLELPQAATRVEVCDLGGRCVATASPLRGTCTVAVGHLDEGLYLLRVRLPDGDLTRRLVIVR